MEINIGTVITVLVIIFSINIVGVATGLYPEARANGGNLIQGSTYSNISTNYNTDALDPYTTEYSGQSGTASNDKDFITAGIDFINQVFSNIGTFMSLIGNIMFGYRYIFISLGLPSLFVWLFTGIILFIQIGCILYLASYVSSIIRGTNII